MHLVNQKVEEAEAYEDEHNVMEKAKNIVVDTFQAMAAFVEKHQLVERGARAVESSANFVTLKLRKCASKDNTV